MWRLERKIIFWWKWELDDGEMKNWGMEKILESVELDQL